MASYSASLSKSFCPSTPAPHSSSRLLLPSGRLPLLRLPRGQSCGHSLHLRRGRIQCVELDRGCQCHLDFRRRQGLGVQRRVLLRQRSLQRVHNRRSYVGVKLGGGERGLEKGLPTIAVVTAVVGHAYGGLIKGSDGCFDLRMLFL